MVWAGISSRAQEALVFACETMDAIAYTDMMQSMVVPFVEKYDLKGMTFLQDSAPAHAAKHTIDFLMEEGKTEMV